MLQAFIISVILVVVSCLQTIAIIGTNDIHGAAFPTTLSRQDTKQKYTYGGLVYMARLIQILQEQYQQNSVYLDAGDQFQGGIESSPKISNGSIMNDFYKMMNLSSSAIGNHQFDFGPNFLFPYMQNKEGQGSNLAANLRSQNGQMDFLPKQKSSKMISFPSGIKIGIIGLVTLETPTSTSAFSKGDFPLYQFLQYKRFVEDQSYKLRKAGANAVLILSHVGDLCYGDINYRQSWDQFTAQDACAVDQMTQLLKSLPQGTVDGVVQGHRHRFVHHFINGIPYMGVINGGYYLNVMYLTFNDQKQIINKTIEGPIPVCERVFANIGRCNYLSKQQLQTAGQLQNWKFHNRDVYAHQKLNQLYTQKWLPLMQQYLVDLVDNQLQLYKIETAESPLGNLITTLVHEAVEDADFVILNPGGFRTRWFPGVIQYQHFYNMFPFPNKLLSFEITGKQLNQLLQTIQNGKDGFYHAWNILMNVSYNSDTNQKHFNSANFTDGSPIINQTTYKGVTLDFLLEGNDDFKQVINIIYTPRNVVEQGDFKQLVKPKLIEKQTIRQQDWIDPNNPRIIVQYV